LQKKIAFFDFDGTITHKDTMLELAKHTHGLTRYRLGMLLLSPSLIAMKMGLLSRQKAKEKFLTYFFKNTSLEKFTADCVLFSEKVIPRLIRQDAWAAIQKHQEENTPVVVVSASADNWVAPWCVQHKLQYICTGLEVKENKITGKLSGKNCNGPEKVSRIKELFDTADYTTIYCYGDSNGDQPMLQIATQPYYRIFKQ
jgi:phosphatidylglycerophosphatase C